MSAIIVPARCIYLIDMLTGQAATSKFGHERGVRSKITVLIFNFIILYYSFSIGKNLRNYKKTFTKLNVPVKFKI
jgi:hypothetical protein